MDIAKAIDIRLIQDGSAEIDGDRIVFDGVRYHLGGRGYWMSYAGQHGDKEMMLHRAVWSHFNGPIPPGYNIHHEDRDKANNQLSNLSCLTTSQHRYEHSPLSEHERERLVAAYRQYGSIVKAAEATGKSSHTIRRAVRRAGLPMKEPHPVGEASPRAKLRDDQREEIRDLAKDGRSQRELAKMFCVSQRQIGRIIRA